MTPEEKAQELIMKFVEPTTKFNTINGVGYFQDLKAAKQCALIAAKYIISSNPHSNPFNTNVHSTMDYWEEVKQELEMLLEVEKYEREQ